VYRIIQQAFIDMENMFDLLKEEQEVSSAVLIAIHAVVCLTAFSALVGQSNDYVIAKQWYCPSYCQCMDTAVHSCPVHGHNCPQLSKVVRNVSAWVWLFIIEG